MLQNLTWNWTSSYPFVLNVILNSPITAQYDLGNIKFNVTEISKNRNASNSEKVKLLKDETGVSKNSSSKKPNWFCDIKINIGYERYEVFSKDIFAENLMNLSYHP